MKTRLPVLGCFLLGCLVTWALAGAVRAAEFHLHPGTNDLGSFIAAQRQAQQLLRLSNETSRLILHGGTYFLRDTLRFHPEDNGLTIEAAPGEQPVLSGAVKITGWKPAPLIFTKLPKAARGKVWVAQVPDTDGKIPEFRQLWVGDLKAARARMPSTNAMARILSLDRTNRTITVPRSALGHVRDATDLELVIQQIWEIAILRVSSFQLKGGTAELSFQSPEGPLEFSHPWPPPVISTNGNSPFYLVNRLEFLDSPGEWFEDLDAGKVYYWPRPGESLTNTPVYAPLLETLVEVSGSADLPVENLSFKGIRFSHSSWLRPSIQGHVPLQAGMPLLDAYKLRPPGVSFNKGLDNQAWIARAAAAVTVQGAHHVTFDRCRFEHLGMSGLDFIDTTHDNLVQGCVFRDIGGNGLQVGRFSDPATETHIPYNPSDERVISTREQIRNNLFTDCGTEDWGCVGIAAGYVRNVTIAHNEVTNLPYTGISVGWGWTKVTNCLRDNFITANRVHHVGQRLIDLGGIYTLSAQPGTVIASNSISDITVSRWVSDRDHWFYLYLDEGSSGITVQDNWCPSEKFLRNANGPGNVWTNNGPQVSDAIKSAAGLEPAYHDLVSPLTK